MNSSSPKYTASPEEKWHLNRMNELLDFFNSASDMTAEAWEKDFLPSYEAIQERIRLANEVGKPEYAAMLKAEIRKINRHL